MLTWKPGGDVLPVWYHHKQPLWTGSGLHRPPLTSQLVYCLTLACEKSTQRRSSVGTAVELREDVCVSGVLLLPWRSESRWGELIRNQKSPSSFKMTPGQMHKPPTC